MIATLIAHALFWLLGTPGVLPADQVPVAERNDSTPRLAVPRAPSTMDLQREVFSYVAAGRRDPFLPTALPVEDGPRIQDATLLGVIFHSDPRRRVVVMSVSGKSAVDGVGANSAGPRSGSEITHRLQLDGRVGNIRVLEIHERRVVIEVESNAGPVRRSLEFPTAQPGGSS